MASGAPPFHGDSVGLIFDGILNRAPAPVGRLNPGCRRVERIVGKCLEKDRELRYQHASEIRADLQRLQRDRQSALRARQNGGRAACARAASRTVVVDRRCPRCSGTRGYDLQPTPPTLTDKDTIVLADFVNRTGDPVFDDTLRHGLAVQLQQSPFLSLISEERIRRTLPLMKPADARLTPDLAQGVCAGRRRRRPGRIDRGARQVSTSSACARRPAPRRHSRRRAGTGGTKRRCPEHAQSDCDSRSNASWRIARHHRETLDAARGGDDAVARSAAGLQRGFKAALAGSPVRACRCFNVRSRSIPILRWPMRMSGSATAGWGSRRSRDRACSRPTSCAIGPATSSASTSTRYATATSRGTWNESDERWKRGPSYPRDAAAHLDGGSRPDEHRPT